MGENNSGSHMSAEVQDYETLLKNCLMNGSLFEDPLFPASNESLMFSRRPDRYIEWMRPHVSLVHSHFKGIFLIFCNKVFKICEGY